MCVFHKFDNKNKIGMTRQKKKKKKSVKSSQQFFKIPVAS